ncbi:Lytic polysaccharide monooxygenase [Pyrenophora tritici-repentis]|uniref:Lytic polysaccharide monooxygenase n=1 Tax=Pyrenophora tritici-repentis TaxID=45151 RepID=A0A2W1F8L0_9PLEO|nr:hypothetical protein PtrV1_11623 [Pyrenophora tritici-repentis]KAF7444426.1 Lytic polysaccharide monooxygenase [Pyrenophora tritici-repentis]KAG9378669.1 Lytic polysaccharide monooxygenase [Pyrenophora tritici-repentis]KAI0615006.1 Lytic polysaccharide monooxygenase [Pyrenophora tritici-repentis]KAI1508769.1 Lytic polysaccharide monooxygenase [Pyrenophora tritici-repentis]
MAAAALFATVNAHVKMTKPVPFSVDTLDTSPISKGQFPCKSQLGFKVSQTNTMKVGEKNTLVLDGSAVHGGGSCQLSVTMDEVPTENSVFKVIMSMEGGCPGVEGPAKSYDFVLPDSIPNGKATFAWTWMSKLAGQPELYMNCAPIEVTGGASDKTKFDALPDLLKINLDKSCESVPNSAVQFPNPGQNVLKGATGDLKAPIGNACGSSGSAPADPPAGGAPSAAPTAPSAGQLPAAPSPPAGGAPSATVSSPAAGQPPAAPTKPAGGKPSPPPSNPGGGVFAPGASSGPALPTSTTLVTVTATPTAPTGAGPTAPAGVSPPSPIGTGTPSTPSTPSSPSAGGGSGTCTTNGAIVCNGATQFGLCNNGNVVWQAVAAGTTCVNGNITKRAYYGRVARPRRSSRRVVPN